MRILERFFAFSFLFAAVAFFSVTASAKEISAFPVKSPDGELQVRYLVEKKSSVLLLCSFTPDPVIEGNAPYIKNVNAKTHICTEDANYSLLKTVHFPIMEEAESKYAYLKQSQGTLNFILEFEKFPYDEPFDLVDGGNGALFNVKGLTVGSKTSVDTDSFLSATPYSEYGCYYEEGSPVHYFDDGEVGLASVGFPYTSNGDYYMSVEFWIVNRSSAPFTVKYKDVTAKATRRNKRNQEIKCDVSVFNAKDADRKWKDADEIEVMHERPTTAGDIVAGAAGRAAFSPGMPVLGSLGLFAVGLLATAASQPEDDTLMTERNREREETMKYYLTESVVQPGDTLRTFVGMGYRHEPSSTTVSISVNGEPYSMKY